MSFRISNGPNSHPKASSWVEDYSYTYILSKDHISVRCGTLIAPLKMWMGNGPVETAQAQHLRQTTAIWTTCTCYIGSKLFMREIICWTFTILVMSLTHTQKLAHEWKIAHTHIYCPRITYVSDVGHINRKRASASDIPTITSHDAWSIETRKKGEALSNNRRTR